MSDQSAPLPVGRDEIEICQEIQEIVKDYREERGSTPGGLEHMGDVWRLLSIWDSRLKRAADIDVPKLVAPVEAVLAHTAPTPTFPCEGGGGNDTIYCQRCGLEWEYARTAGPERPACPEVVVETAPTQADADHFTTWWTGENQGKRSGPPLAVERYAYEAGLAHAEKQIVAAKGDAQLFTASEVATIISDAFEEGYEDAKEAHGRCTAQVVEVYQKRATSANRQVAELQAMVERLRQERDAFHSQLVLSRKEATSWMQAFRSICKEARKNASAILAETAPGSESAQSSRQRVAPDGDPDA